VENELKVGVAGDWEGAALHRIAELIFTLVVFGLFHWPFTQNWAIVPASTTFSITAACDPGLLQFPNAFLAER
jgi:hypothetical protein